MADLIFGDVNLSELAKKDPAIAEIFGDTVSDADYSGLPLDGLTPAEIHQTGVDYRDGAHYKKTDLGLAKKYFQAAADRGFAPAWAELGLAYCNDLIPNYEKAIQWWKKAADAGNEGAMFAIGELFDFGRGVEKNPEEALRWFRKAADAGCAEAWYRLGSKAFFASKSFGGLGGAESSYNAFECYQKAADMGHEGAMYNVGKMYRAGDGVRQNREKAAFWLEKAVEAGHGSALDMLCEMYKKREVPNPKYKSAEEWLQAAPCGADAAVNLAASYRNMDGKNPPPFSDYAKAVYWYERAAAKGSVKAMNKLAALYSRGGKPGETSTLPIDMNKAARWVIKAAESGDADAMYTYSMWLDPPDGFPSGGVPRDKAKSFAWLQKAAEAGSAHAMYQMGEVYSYDYYGNGLVPIDLKKAREWYIKAKEHGSDIAYAAINIIDEKLQEQTP